MQPIFKSRFFRWGLVVVILLLLLLWWLLRTLGSGGQSAPAGNALPLSNTEPAVRLPLSNIPQGVLGPPTPAEQEEQKEAETPHPAPAPVLFPLKNTKASPSLKTQVAAVKTTLTHLRDLSPAEKRQIRLTLKTQPALAEGFANLLAVNPKDATLAAAHFNSLTPAEKHQIGLALKAQPALAGNLSNLLVADGQRAAQEAAHSTQPAPTLQTPAAKTTPASPKHISSEEKHLIRLVMKAQPALAKSLAHLRTVNPKRAALAAAHYNNLPPAEKHQIGLALKAEPLLATRLTNILVVDGERAVLGAVHFNGLPAKDKNQIDQTLKAQPSLVDNLAKLILEPTKYPELASPSAGGQKKKKRRGGLDHEMEWWGYRCGVNADQTIVIKDDDAWDKFRAGFPMPPGWTPEKEAVDPRLRRPPPVLPDVDFDKMMVIGTFLGKVQEGYRIVISTAAITADHKTMNVDYGTTFPLPNPMAGSALDEPYDIMVIKRFDGDVYFWNKP